MTAAPPSAGWFEPVPELDAAGFRAFTTTRAAGSFGTAGDEPVGAVMARWDRLREAVAGARGRLATARQVHGARVLVHGAGWEGWLRGPEADGHFAAAPDTALAVSVADCVPVFVTHPSGAVALLHSGWRGTAAHIIDVAIGEFVARGLPAAELAVHTGPAICGRCYEVSPDVYAQLTGRAVPAPTAVDLRALILDHARARGVHMLSASAACTRCDNDRFFSHRAGEPGRQVAVLLASG